MFSVFVISTIRTTSRVTADEETDYVEKGVEKKRQGFQGRKGRWKPRDYFIKGKQIR